MHGWIVWITTSLGWDDGSLRSRLNSALRYKTEDVGPKGRVGPGSMW